MVDPDQPLIVTQPVLGPIGSAEVERAIPDLRGRRPKIVEIAPTKTDLASARELDWPSLEAEQDRLFETSLRPEIAGRRLLSYFGLSPIPLAMHLGYRVQATIRSEVYLRHHGRGDYAWDAHERARRRASLIPSSLPEHGSTDVGPLVVRVSTAHRIHAMETNEVVPSSLAQVDVAVVKPDLDALETREAVEQVALEFRKTLERLRSLFPNRTEIHVFAAVPVGLAFLMGTHVNPTVYPDVVTYQYLAKERPRYRRAIVLTEKKAAPNVAVAFHAAPTEATEIDLSRTALGSSMPDWSNPVWDRLHRLLCDALPDSKLGRPLLLRCGFHEADLAWEVSARTFWTAALDQAARSARMGKLIHRLLEHGPIAAFHDVLREIVASAQEEEMNAR